MWVWKSVYQGGSIMILSFVLFRASFLQIVTITFSALIILEILNVVTILTKLKLVHVLALSLTLLVYFLSIYFLRDIIDVGIINLTFFEKTGFIVVVAWVPMHFGHLIRKRIWPEEHEKLLTDKDDLASKETG